jgi:hypothetical protein
LKFFPSKVPSRFGLGLFVFRIESEFLSQLAQLLCQKTPTRLIQQKSKLQNTLILQQVFAGHAVGISQAKIILLEQKHLTKGKL